MNVTELETYLNNHDKVIRTVFPWSTPNEGMKEDRDIDQFDFKIYYTLDDLTVRDPAIRAIVVDWDGPNETVYLKIGGVPPFLLKEKENTPFKSRVETTIDTIVTNNDDFYHGKLIDSDEDDKIAIASIYVYNSTDDVVEDVRYIIWEKGDGSLGYKKLLGSAVQ